MEGRSIWLDFLLMTDTVPVDVRAHALCSVYVLRRCGGSGPSKKAHIAYPQITMSKLEGVKTVVVGGKQDVPQQYCGIVGGQSTDFSTIDTQIKVRGRLTNIFHYSTHDVSFQSAGLKNNSLAPPDL